MAALLTACGGGGDGGGGGSPTLPPRTYVMGFSGVPPRFDAALVPRVVDLFARRADAGLVLQEPPWAELLSGGDLEALVRANPLGIADYLRGKGLRVIASIDPADGLDRSRDSPARVAAGRSLAEPEIRELYRRYVGAFMTLVRPEALTLASETNLIRAVAPASVYAAVVTAAIVAAAEARQRDPALRLMITVLVDVANGRLPGGVGEGILDTARALAWFQITFTDLDAAVWPAGIAPFASLGLVDINLQPKPALGPWDAAFARSLERR